MATEIKRSPEISPSTVLATKPAAGVGVTPATASSSFIATPATVVARPTEPDVDVIHIPSYSRWFTWNAIHECETRFVPEFFDGRSPSKNPKVYKYYRNSIIRRFRENSTRKITFTEVRKTIVGDVGSIRRVFDFLESWGLINYSSPSKPQPKLDDKEAKAGAAPVQLGDGHGGGANVSTSTKRVCSSCKAPCTIACFVSEKDFKRIEISEEAKSDWSEKETLQLLEALLHYGDDWKKVANHVGNGRSAKDCVARFIKLPFGEQFHGPPESVEPDTESLIQNAAMPNKRLCLTPLADTSNPIMAQVAFLSTLVGVDVAKVAASAAVAALSDLDNKTQQGSDDAANGKEPNALDDILHKARTTLEKEEEEQEGAISGIANQVKEIEDKIHRFEELDLQMEKKRQQFHKLQNQVFIDQLTLLFNRDRTCSPKKGGETSEAMKIDNVDVQLPM